MEWKKYVFPMHQLEKMASASEEKNSSKNEREYVKKQRVKEEGNRTKNWTMDIQRWRKKMNAEYANK